MLDPKQSCLDVKAISSILFCFLLIVSSVKSVIRALEVSIKHHDLKTFQQARQVRVSRQSKNRKDAKNTS